MPIGSNFMKVRGATVRWTQKARIMKLCAELPRGDVLYRFLQSRFGNLDANPFKRVPHHVKMHAVLMDASFQTEGSRCLEVGTGHIPTIPLLMHLVGAQEVVSVDLHRRLRWDLTGRSMAMLADSADDLVAMYGEQLTAKDGFRERLRLMGEYASNPQSFFDRVGIRYVAPGDAAKMAEASGSFDLHFSATTFEHIDPSALRDILREAQRLLRSGGVAAHMVSLSDHFAHQDPSISYANFLRFSDRDWAKIAGNEFAYCNRLRPPEYLALFEEAELSSFKVDAVVDDRALAEIDSGALPIDGRFSGFSPEELATIGLHIFARR